MVVFNDLDCLHLVADLIDRLPGLCARVAYVKQALREQLIDHKHYVHQYGRTCLRTGIGNGGRPRNPT